MFERVDLTRECALCRLALGGLELALSRWEPAESHYRHGLAEGAPFSRIQIRGGVGLSLLAMDRGDLPAAVNGLLGCFALPGPIRAGDTLRLIEASLFCLTGSRPRSEVEGWHDEIKSIRNSTGLAEDHLDHIVYNRISGRGRASGQVVEGSDDLRASVLLEIDRLRANNP